MIEKYEEASYFYKGQQVLVIDETNPFYQKQGLVLTDHARNNPPYPENYEVMFSNNNGETLDNPREFKSTQLKAWMGNQ